MIFCVSTTHVPNPPLPGDDEKNSQCRLIYSSRVAIPHSRPPGPYCRVHGIRIVVTYPYRSLASAATAPLYIAPRFPRAPFTCDNASIRLRNPSKHSTPSRASRTTEIKARQIFFRLRAAHDSGLHLCSFAAFIDARLAVMQQRGVFATTDRWSGNLTIHSALPRDF